MLRNIQLPQDCSSKGFDSISAKEVALVGGCKRMQGLPLLLLLLAA
jgi:hypothetical protein